MQRFRFLLSRRWAFFLVAVVLLTWLATWLGQWQFGRLEDRKDRNAIVLRNEQAEPAEVTEVLSPGAPVASDVEWRNVTATGTYLTDKTVVVRYRTGDNGRPGVQVIVPLRLTAGDVLLVDRGWWATANRGAVPDDVPAPPSGEVTVTGWVRADATGDSTKVSDQSTRAVSSVAIAPAIDENVLGGFIQLATESPEAEQPLTLPELPDLSEGPHFFYGIQWWFFGVLAVAGFFYLAYDEYRDRQAEQNGSTPSDDPQESTL